MRMSFYYSGNVKLRQKSEEKNIFAKNVNALPPRFRINIIAS